MQIIKNNGQMPISDTSTQHNTLSEANLDNVDCPICNNKGYILRTDEQGITWARDCECMKKRISLRNVEDSGLKDLVSKYTFENYKAETKEQEIVLRKAKEFLITDAECFVIFGQSGSGKTHICTAITSKLIENGWKAKYFLWRTDAAILKSMVTEGDRYQWEINKLRNVPVLYIDDLFKGSISEADINLAFTILNERYNHHGKKTIISTELTMPKLMSIDEAVGSRIVERAKGYIVEAPSKNMRLQE